MWHAPPPSSGSKDADVSAPMLSAKTKTKSKAHILAGGKLKGTIAGGGGGGGGSRSGSGSAGHVGDSHGAAVVLGEEDMSRWGKADVNADAENPDVSPMSAYLRAKSATTRCV